jgi:hypothetical protein
MANKNYGKSMNKAPEGQNVNRRSKNGERAMNVSPKGAQYNKNKMV